MAVHVLKPKNAREPRHEVVKFSRVVSSLGSAIFSNYNQVPVISSREQELPNALDYLNQEKKKLFCCCPRLQVYQMLWGLSRGQS